MRLDVSEFSGLPFVGILGCWNGDFDEAVFQVHDLVLYILRVFFYPFADPSTPFDKLRVKAQGKA